MLLTRFNPFENPCLEDAEGELTLSEYPCFLEQAKIVGPLYRNLLYIFVYIFLFCALLYSPRIIVVHI